MWVAFLLHLILSRELVTSAGARSRSATKCDELAKRALTWEKDLGKGEKSWDHFTPREAKRYSVLVSRGKVLAKKSAKHGCPMGNVERAAENLKQQAKHAVAGSPRLKKAWDYFSAQRTPAGAKAAAAVLKQEMAVAARGRSTELVPKEGASLLESGALPGLIVFGIVFILLAIVALIVVVIYLVCQTKYEARVRQKA